MDHMLEELGSHYLNDDHMSDKTLILSESLVFYICSVWFLF